MDLKGNGIMQIKVSNIFLSLCILGLLLIVSCTPVIPLATETPTYTATFTPAYSMTLTAEAATLSMIATETTLTAALSEAPSATPSFTPPAGVTVIPIPGDLGWGAVHGKITDGITKLPVEGATVKCEHFSYTSPYLCNAMTTTNADGIYSFVPVYFHDTDSITLIVEAPGYTSVRFERSFFTQPDFQADLDLFPGTDNTPISTPFLMCTPPPCSGGVLTCGDPKGCPGGCGTICLTATPLP
jgi:hypothetical protein